jgi:hypothetical protein
LGWLEKVATDIGAVAEHADAVAAEAGGIDVAVNAVSVLVQNREPSFVTRRRRHATPPDRRRGAWPSGRVVEYAFQPIETSVLQRLDRADAAPSDPGNVEDREVGDEAQQHDRALVIRQGVERAL